MTKPKLNLDDSYMRYVKGYYVYPEKQIKIWFINNKTRIFPAEQDIIDYIDDHKSEWE